MLRTQHQTKTVQEFVDLHSKKRLNLAPAFQRKAVWTMSDRRLLIQSLFEGIPLPSVYLFSQIGRGGSPVYDVIDGKQRLETILWFLDRGPLAKSGDPLLVKLPLDDEERPEWAGWSDLSKARRNKILTTQIPTIEVDGDLSEIINLFVRINSTGRRLDPQEKRHARYYDSPILKIAQKLADKHQDSLVRTKVLSPAQIQRMKHVELMTELLLGVNAGVHLNKKKKIDEIIQGKGLSTDDLAQAEANVTRALNLVQAVLPDLRTTRFCQMADFYSLTRLLHAIREEGKTVTAHDSARNALAGELLRDFGRGVDEVNDRTRSGKPTTALQKPFLQYLMTVKEGTDSATQRRAREKLLRDVLEGVFDDLDPARSFNPVQRRILWHTSATKMCAYPGCTSKRILKWEDLALDHIEPYIKGGRTHLSNAALMHKKCNAAAGAKG
jgi:hypothetical protein